jgi:deferrochelatase/peroxidase EfeB
MASSSTPIVPLALADIQGNIFGGFNKDFQPNLFLQFSGAASGRAWIAEVSDEIADSSGSDVIEFNNEFKRLKKQGVAKPEDIIRAVWVNLAISFQGLSVLNVNATDLAKFPPAFSAGMANRKSQVGDVGASNPSHWIPPFDVPKNVHAVLLIAADDPRQLQNKVNAITGSAAFKAGAQILVNQAGKTRSDLPGHEHFGFKDGISQPGVRGVDAPDDPIGNPNQGHPGQDSLWPGELVIGYNTQIPKINASGVSPDPGPISSLLPNSIFRAFRSEVLKFC